MSERREAVEWLLQVTGARASAVCKRILLFHLTPRWGGSRRVRSGGMKVVGVGGCVRRFEIVRPIVAYAARARTGSSRGGAMCRVAK